MSVKKIIATLIAIAALPALAAQIEGKVIRVSDGDTIVVLDGNKRQQRVRFLGIDSPELKQEYGRSARKNLSDKIAGKKVTISFDERDRYGRILGTVYLGESNINLLQIEEGYAWYYRYYARDVQPSLRRAYDRAETQARKARLGLWQQKDPTPPWDWRRENRRQ